MMADRRLQNHVAHAGLQRRGPRDRIVRANRRIRTRNRRRAGRHPSARPVTCRLAGVVFAPINPVMSARAGADASASRARASPAVLMRCIAVHSSTIALKSCEISSLQSARGRVAHRARPHADARADANVSHEGRVASFPGRRPAVRDPRADHLGAHRRQQPAHLDSARLRAGFHRLQLHGPPARGGPPHDLCATPARRGARAGLAVRRAERDLREPVHALAPGSSRRARVR